VAPLILSAVALCLTLPFAARGYYGDDARFHISSWIGMRQAWITGSFAPGWDSLANFRLGDPRFCFYPPLSLWMGALLCFLVPFKLAPAAFVWLALLTAGLSMYVAARSLLGARFSMAAAVLYMMSPYLIVTAITRFAVAELLVLAWLPLIILHFVRAIGDLDRSSMFWLALLLALSWLTDIPASIALGYTLALTSCLEAIRRRSARALLTFTIAESIAILCAAFRLAPAYFEKSWITTSALLRWDFRNYFMFHTLSDTSRLKFTIGMSVIAIVYAALMVIAFWVLRCRPELSQSLVLYEMAAASLLFQLPFSAVLWTHLPELRYVQFPFRFLSVIGGVLPFILFGKGVNRALTWSACGVLIVLTLMPIASYLRVPQDTPSRLPSVERATNAGYPGTDEYTPFGAATLSAPLLTWSPTVVDGNCTVSLLPVSTSQKQVEVDAQKPCTIRLGSYYYPFWKVTDESGKYVATASDGAGILTARVTEGRHTINVNFRMNSTARNISELCSAAGLLVLIGGFWRGASNPAFETVAS